MALEATTAIHLKEITDFKRDILKELQSTQSEFFYATCNRLCAYGLI